MMSKWRWLLLQLTHRLWIRASFFALIGVATALVGVAAERFVPVEVPDLIGSDAVGSVLNILASSMLAVTTFSLGVMVSAYGAATTNVTPRATRLLIADTTSQNALSTFLGSFLFSLVGIVTLTIAGYGERGRLVLFVVTIGVIVIIVVTMLRWMEYLTRLGRVSETTARVEEAALQAIDSRLRAPCLGGRSLRGKQVPAHTQPLTSGMTGYVQHIDLDALQHIAESAKAQIYVEAKPGAFAHEGMRLAAVDGTLEPRQIEAARDAFTIDDLRTYEQDPRFGVIVLSEIGTRALSAAVNDSGTAIDVIGRIVRVLLRWAKGGEEAEVRYDRIWVLPIDEADLIDDAFSTIARDGAGRLEVQIRLQKALFVLGSAGNPVMRRAAAAMAERASKLAQVGLTAADWTRLEAEIQRLK